eukprot:9627608-Alexandrium_andersonii.AAC.1
MAQAMRADWLYEGQVIIAPIVWTSAATSRLHDRLKEITLGVDSDVGDMPGGQRTGAVAAVVR